MATIEQVANYFITASKESTPRAVTPFKLQKLVYFAQKRHVNLHNTLLFNEEMVVWEQGPVNKQLHEQHKVYGYGTILRKEIGCYIDRLEEKEEQSVEEVWVEFGGYDGKLLEELVWLEDLILRTPFDEPIQFSDAPIGKEEMKDV